jgi:hypothetical protein
MFVAVSSSVVIPFVSHAGMPSFTLTEMAHFRLSTISFFLLIYVLASLCIYKLWNYLRKDFPRLPQLPFRKAMLLVFVWGFAFHLLLVMIAGTRELMTPEAWEKAGVIHKLSPDKVKQYAEMRRHKLSLLKEALWKYADDHGGAFPLGEERSRLPDELWLAPAGDLQYHYVEGVSRGGMAVPVAYEPDAYGYERFTLLSNGSVELLPIEVVERLAKGGDK